VVIESVTCTDFPEQSYALFLPSSYSPDRPAPIVYAFDPAARGRLPVELLKDAAEKYGYIVVGSNNSRNGPVEPQQAAANAVWRDTLARFVIDLRRVYFTGFSGGARIATFLAIGCNCAAGVISHGAGFPSGTPLESPIAFNYFATVGNLDFNFPEVTDVAAHLDANGSTNRLWQFPGTHQWAPAEVWEEALLWMELQAVKNADGPRRATFVEQQLARAAQRAAALEEAGSAHAAAYEYRKLAQDFSGLTDTSEFERKAAELAGTKAFQRARKQQEDEIARQRRITGEFLGYLDILQTDPGSRHEALYQIRRLAGEWKSRLDKKDEVDVALRRALHGVFAFAYEAGLRALRENDPVRATGHFEVAGEIASESPMPLFHLARARALAGNGKGALRALRKAVEKGFSYPELIRQADEFASLQGKKEFRDILARLEQQSPSQP
jgi:dienelactone hydrolase